jgi:hypothetical protein
LEDDVVLNPNWLEVYNFSSSALQSNWEVLKLHWQMPFPTAFSMAAYVIRAGAAADILKKLFEVQSATPRGGAWAVFERNIDSALPAQHVNISLAKTSCVATENVPCRSRQS